MADGSAPGASPADAVAAIPASRADRGQAPEDRPSRAGRNLPAAIVTGVLLGAAIIASLAFRREVFLVIVVAAVAVAVWELRGVLSAAGSHIPFLPTLVGSLAMVLGAYAGGGQALAVTLGLTCVAILLWRVADGANGALRDVGAGVLVAVYPGFLAGFASLMLRPEDGSRRVLIFLILVVCSDIGGYVVGVIAGRHPMAPSISPKKSWEGFSGSLLACGIAGGVCFHLMTDSPWWYGVIVGAVVAPAATLGDLVESTIKRDLGIKDMGHVMPGHGGIMDRLDSLVVVAPIVWALLTVLLPL